jgi:purine-nucleoside phosphorylase
MTYQDLLNGIGRFGSTIEDVCQLTIGISTDEIKERVIIAPWWEPHVFSNLGNEITFLSSSGHSGVNVWNIKSDSFEITYIKTGIGAPVITDALLVLGATPCKKAVFVGSVGALDPSIGIGDIVIPEFSISGDGVGRYLKGGSLKNNDPFGEINYPSSEMYHGLKNTVQKVCELNNIQYHIGKTFSTDSIFAQFAHIDEIVSLGCNVIEMETASAFRAASLSGISLGALCSVSDNTMLEKTLYHRRTSKDVDLKKEVRRNIFPKILLEVLR